MTARETDTPSGAVLRAALERFDAAGGFAYGHVAHGPTDASGYCPDCDRARPYDGWHERAEAAAEVRAALAATEAPSTDDDEVEHHVEFARARLEARPETDLDVERLARAMVFRRYGIRVKDANPADVDDAKAVAEAYRRDERP